ncbi:MAG: hypothetical protein K0U41_09880 [Gammaproteobacteria bacterium]|nr:hypothetical protein [Gammaproteobacteria bacterium]
MGIYPRSGPILTGMYPAVDEIMKTPEFKELLRLRNLLIKYHRLMGSEAPEMTGPEVAHKYPNDRLELEFDLDVYRIACIKYGLVAEGELNDV